MTIKWCDPPIPEEPRDRLPRTFGPRELKTVPVINHLGRLIQTPSQWYWVAEGHDSAISPRAVHINQSKGLPGRWEAVTRGDRLYARFLGFDEEVTE